MPKKAKRSLEEIVGRKVYSVWTDMLHKLVPGGRSHRLAPTVAAMLQYAAEIAHKKHRAKAPEGSVAYSLLVGWEESDEGTVEPLLLPIVEQLFKDSRVRSKRVSSRGDGYSIAESAIHEFRHWDDMPWEH